MSEWLQVRQVFERALDVAPAERAAFVERQCQDPELRREVLELLTSARESEGALEQLDGAVMCEALERQLAIPELRGQRIGAYQIRRVLASGGMGVVFEAEQQNPKRRVALKMVRIGFDPGEGVRRLRHEAELLARLRHPCIAQVFEAGVHRVTGGDGRSRELPWFAMEFVEDARTVLEYAREQSLKTNQVLELFRSVCDAVHHGHQRCVIHRDLKPENILVDRAGRPKVIDFGVARAVDPDHDRENMTGAGQILGTLQYMSPEQVTGRRLEVDARSDVYSLGIVLFELLTGSPPYDLEGLGVQDIARTISETPPRQLRAHDRALAGDLEVIVGKALAKDPDRRYRSAAEFGDDLGRYLQREPILARLPSRGYQLRMFVRRHGVLLGAAILVLLASVTAAIVSLGAASAARRAEAQAAAERDNATRLFDRLMDLSLVSLFDFQERMVKVEGATEIRRDMVAKSLSNLEALEEQVGGDPRLLASVSRGYTRLARLQGDTSRLNLGDLATARDHFHRALTLAERATAAVPGDPDARLAIAEAEAGLGSMAADEAKVDEAVGHYRRAIGIFADLRGGDPLLYDMPLASAWSGIGTVLFTHSRRREALEAYQKGEAITRAASQAAPEDYRRLGNQAASLTKLGALLTEEDRPEEALDCLQRALAVQEELCRLQPGDVRTRFYLTKQHFVLCEFYLRASRFAEGEEVVRRSLPILDDLAESHPGTVNYPLGRAYGRQLLGRTLVGRADAAGDPSPEIYQEARALLAGSMIEVRAMIDDGAIGGRQHEHWLLATRRAMARCEQALQAR